jgi:hypothetical protein
MHALGQWGPRTRQTAVSLPVVVVALGGGILCLAVGYTIGAARQRIVRLRLEYRSASKLSARLKAEANLSREDLAGIVEKLGADLLQELKPWGPGSDARPPPA